MSSRTVEGFSSLLFTRFNAEEEEEEEEVSEGRSITVNVELTELLQNLCPNKRILFNGSLFSLPPLTFLSCQGRGERVEEY